MADKIEWSGAIKIAERGGFCTKPIPRYAADGKLFVVYEAGMRIHLSSFDGKKITYEKAVSESGLKCFEPYLQIVGDRLHAAWAECTEYADDIQYIKYRCFDGAAWSEIITLAKLDIGGALKPPFVMRKIEDLRMAVDENHNVFIVYMIHPIANCQFISKYGGTIRLETWWPIAGRSKHPDIAVDSNYIHVAWQQLWGKEYTIAYCRRPNIADSLWEAAINVRDGIHRPIIGLDPAGNPHVYYQEDVGETGRNCIYKYWTGNGFSPKFIVSDDRPRSYSNLSMGVFDEGNIFTIDLMATIYFNWKQSGKWAGHKSIPNVQAQSDYPSCALSPDGRIAAVVYVSRAESIYMQIGSSDAPPPLPPPPIPEPPIPPIIPDIPPDESETKPVKPLFNWQGWWNNNKKIILSVIGGIVVLSLIALVAC